MSEIEPPTKLTPEQVVMLFERQLNRAVVWNMAVGFGSLVAAIALVLLVEPYWVGLVLGGGLIIAGSIAQRVLALRVRCPVCGARALRGVHSIFQVRSVRECPSCGVSLRN